LDTKGSPKSASALIFSFIVDITQPGVEAWARAWDEQLSLLKVPHWTLSSESTLYAKNTDISYASLMEYLEVFIMTICTTLHVRVLISSEKDLEPL
jgi:hypothetical protein